MERRSLRDADAFDYPPNHRPRRFGGVETEVRAQSDDVSNAANLLWANCEPFEAEAGNIRGSYLLRFLDGLTILAEGRFVLK